MEVLPAEIAELTFEFLAELAQGAGAFFMAAADADVDAVLGRVDADAELAEHAAVELQLGLEGAFALHCFDDAAGEVAQGVADFRRQTGAATKPDEKWIFVIDQLNTHKSESLVRLVIELGGLEVNAEELVVKGKSGISLGLLRHPLKIRSNRATNA